MKTHLQTLEVEVPLPRFCFPLAYPSELASLCAMGWNGGGTVLLIVLTWLPTATWSVRTRMGYISNEIFHPVEY